MLVVFCMVRTFGLFGYLRCAIFRLVLSMADFFNENASPKAYCDYLTTDNFQPAWYHYSSEELSAKKTKKTGDKKEWENNDVLMDNLDSFYESLQAFFNFLDIYEKQIKIIKDLCNISNDTIEEIPQN